MPEHEQKDNRASAWVARRLIADVRGRVAGAEVFGLVVQTGMDKPKPKYEVWVRSRDGAADGVLHAALYTDDKFPRLKASGVIETPVGKFWVSLWANEPSDNEKAPQLGLTFKPQAAREPKPEPPPAERERVYVPANEDDADQPIDNLPF